MAAPRHVLLELDDDDDDRSIASASSAAFGIESSATSFSARRDLRAPPPPFEPADDDGRGGSDDGEDPSDDDDVDEWSPRAPERRRSGGPATVADEDGGARTTSSRFWGVCWHRGEKNWWAYYRDADGKKHGIGYYYEEEEAARAVNKAISDAGLEGKRRMNAVDATGALVPKVPGASKRLDQDRDRAAVVAPDAARAPTETTSKYWGVTWNKGARRWKAEYTDANSKTRYLGLFDTQEAAAHAVNAAISALPPHVQARRNTNPVVDGQLVPRARKAPGHGVDALSGRKRGRRAATPSTRARRQRRADE